MRQFVTTSLSFFAFATQVLVASMLVLGSISAVEAKKSDNSSHGHGGGDKEYFQEEKQENNQQNENHGHQGSDNKDYDNRGHGNSHDGNNQGHNGGNNQGHNGQGENQPSLEVYDVSVSTNTCEKVAGSFKVKNTSGSSVYTTGVFGVLQAHVPPSKGGYSHFFEIKKIQISDFSLSSYESKEVYYSISGFSIPPNTNSIRVEIQVNIAGRDKTFVTRSDSFKPCLGSNTGSDNKDKDNDENNNGHTNGQSHSNGATTVSSNTPQVQSPSVLASISQLPATGSNLAVPLVAYISLLFLGIALRRMAQKLSA